MAHDTVNTTLGNVPTMQCMSVTCCDLYSSRHDLVGNTRLHPAVGRAMLGCTADVGNAAWFIPTLVRYVLTAAHLPLCRHCGILQESYLERIERLAFKDKERADATKTALAEHYYAQCTFQPKINTKSKKMVQVTA